VIDWGLVARVAGGGFGVTLLVLVILSVVIQVTGLVAQRLEPKGEDTK
jgi:Na+-transporting methylmalonyl-CoA/oxaloacetate decarboxylase gamma subunit